MAFPLVSYVKSIPESRARGSKRQIHCWALSFFTSGAQLLEQKQGIEITAVSLTYAPYIFSVRGCGCPVASGGGTRIKILKPWPWKGSGSTPLGAEGLRFKAGQEICIAEPRSIFSGRSAASKRTPHSGHRLALAARQAAIKHSWTMSFHNWKLFCNV